MLNIKKAFYIRSVINLLLFGGIAAGCAGSEPGCGKSPCEPEEALQSFEVVEGFKVELFAAEPLFSDPVAMEVDEDGNLYVVEDPGYPEDRGEKGAIRFLEDTDGDGKPDKSTVFADSLNAPRGVLSWKDGILVTDAPDILYLEDTTGDNRADVRREILSGFGTGNPQLGVNTPLYGLDNWVYGAHRQSGSKPVFKERPDGKEIRGGNNLRFRPDTYELESLASSSQFGHSFDAFGRHLLVMHNNHIYQEVIGDRYLRRNPDLLAASASEHISDHGAAAEVFPITDEARHELFTDKGQFTAACGITCYLGGNFPEKYQNAAFVAEPAHNLIHADLLEQNGSTLLARRAEEEREFLASTDRWFRPVNFYVGPDGALYIIDYYREVIEQPRFLSDEVLESEMLYDGTDRGRIYRVAPEDMEDPAWLGRLGLKSSSSEKLVSLLEHENIWWRRTAQRILVHRQDTAATDSLKRVAASGGTPEVRVHALWSLDGIGTLSATQIQGALEDESPRVREHAVRLTELYMEDTPALLESLMSLADDPDRGVQFQLLATLGDVEGKRSREIRQKILYDHMEDDWIQLAALSAGDLEYDFLFEQALDSLAARESEERADYFKRLGMLVGSQQQAGQVLTLVEATTNSGRETDLWWQAATLEGLAEGLQNWEEDQSDSNLDSARKKVAEHLLHPTSSRMRRASRQLLEAIKVPSDAGVSEIFQRAAEIAAERGEKDELRADAVGVLNLGQAPEHVDLLKELLNPRESRPVQEAAARVLGSIEGEEVGRFLISRWNRMTPQVRRVVMEALLADDSRIHLVLDAVEQGQIRRSDINTEQTHRLMLNADDELRSQARSLLGLPEQDRTEIVDRYREAMDREGGDPEQGRLVYNRNCAMCHQIEGADGTAFGPDLESARNSRAEDLLVDILIPDAEITAGYEQWRIERTNGETVGGVITSETSGTVTIRNPAGREFTISREDIQSMEAVNASAMPTGLEQQISEEEMADLIEFLKSY